MKGNQMKSPQVIGRILIGALSVALLSGLGACATSPQSSQGSATTISFLSWDNEETMKPIIDAFQADNPDVKIDFSWAPPVQEYIQTLQTRLNAGTAADVFIITAENRTQLMDGGLVTDITSEPFMSNIADAAKVPYTKDGKVYGMATASWGGGLVYNEDLLAKVGFNGSLSSWQDFLDVCQKLKDAGTAPFLDDLSSVPVAVSGLLAIENKKSGGTMDAKIFAGESSFAQTWAAPLTLYKQLADKGYLDKAAVALNGDQVLQEFEAGRVGFIATGSWTPGGIRQAAPDLKFKFIPVPGANAGESGWAGAVSPGLAINAKSDKKEAAAKFLSFMQSKKAVEMYNKATGSITTTKDFTPTVDDSLTLLADGVREGNFYLPMSSWLKGQDALQTDATALIQQMIQGTSTPEQVAAGLDATLKTLG